MCNSLCFKFNLKVAIYSLNPLWRKCMGYRYQIATYCEVSSVKCRHTALVCQFCTCKSQQKQKRPIDSLQIRNWSGQDRSLISMHRYNWNGPKKTKTIKNSYLNYNQDNDVSLYKSSIITNLIQGRHCESDSTPLVAFLHFWNFFTLFVCIPEPQCVSSIV